MARGLDVRRLAAIDMWGSAGARWRPLDAEIEGVDVPAELRHYTTAQLWVAVPLLLVPLAAAQWRRHPR